MSAAATAWVQRQYCPKGRGRSSLKFVLFTIADSCSDQAGHFECRAESIPTIAQKVCQSEREVQRNLHKLEAEGVLKITRQHNGDACLVNIYQIVTGLQDPAPPPPQSSNGHVQVDAGRRRGPRAKLSRGRAAIVIDQCPECGETIDRAGYGHCLSEPIGSRNGCSLVGLSPPEIDARLEVRAL